MPLNSSPRKIVPLNSGDDGSSRRPIPTFTKRAFFCGVVVEGPNDGADLSDDVKDLVASLGDKLPSHGDYDPTPAPSTSSNQANGHGRPRALTNTSALADLINELVVTERNYVQRLRMLKNSYADPLRSYARSKDTAIIAAYEAKILFGNIDQLLPVNEAFLCDIEQMSSSTAAHSVGGIGDVASHHFKELRAFECYKQYYTKREEAQGIFKREMAKKSSTGFAAFVERIKYSANDAKNRVGLRELLMEPVQRIPRYTLLFRSMIKLMGASDLQRAKLVEAEDIASRIALAETDSHTRLAATLNCLAASIEGFPPALISSSRRFIDCIDVVDNLSDTAGLNLYGSSFSSAIGSPTPLGSSGSYLHCTLFLFDDRLMIVKRPVSDKSGRSLACLDDIERFASGVSGRGRGLANMRRGGMSCRGVVDITEVNATDVSGADMHLFLENPPLDQTDRWSGRPLRVLSIILPGAAGLDNARLEGEKKRFLDNLWRVQARYRTRIGQSVALRADEQEVESRAGRVTVAQTYFNVYQRTMFLKEPKKTKVVMHIDSLGDADPLPFGMDGPPYVVIRVRPMPGELCRYSVHSHDPDDEPDEDVVQSARIPARVIQTIHQYGLFKFKTDNPSRPATPSGGSRSRAHIFGLDAISRNLFGTSRNKDASTDSINSHHRSKSAISRTSTLRTESSTTITTANSSSRYTQRSNSTAATSVSSFAVDDGSLGKRSSKSRKLVKRSRSRSPAMSLGDEGEHPETDPANNSLSRRRARSLSVPGSEESLEYSDHEDADTTMLDFRQKDRVTESEMDLSMRLELARRNSRNQHGKTASHDFMEFPIEEIIYEEGPPLPSARPLSRASRRTHSISNHDYDAHSLHSTSPHYTSRSIPPTPESGPESPRKGRADSFHSIPDRRPIGPRSPSPFMPTSPSMNAMQIDIEGALESTLARMSPEKPHTPDLPHLSDHDFDEDDDVFSSTIVHETPSRLPRSTRQPFMPMESTPKRITSNADEELPTGIIPLSIKKKTPSGPSTSGSMQRRPFVKDSVLTQANARAGEKRLREVQDLQRSDSCPSISDMENASGEEELASLVQVTESTRDDLGASQRALKRIRLDISSLSLRAGQDSPKTSDFRPTTPSRGLVPTPSRRNAATREAQARMEEMRALIEQRRGGVVTPRVTRPKSVVEASLSSLHGSISSSLDGIEVQSWIKAIDETASNAEHELGRTISNYTKVQEGINHIVAKYKERTKDLDKTSLALKRTKRQCELLKDLLSNATAENEILYGSFNEELEGLFNEVTLPREEAWTTMSTDLSETKKDRFRLTKENTNLRRKLQETELERDEWVALLRHHGLIT